MYTDDNDIRTPRDRVSEDDFVKYMLSRSQRENRNGQNDRRDSCSCGMSGTRERESCSGDRNTTRERESCSGDRNTTRERESRSGSRNETRERESRSGSRNETRERESCSCNRNTTRERESCSLCRGNRSENDRDKDCSNFFVTLGAPLAAVYSPMQVWRNLYDETRALERGTLFSELDKPFEGRGRKCR